MVAPGLPLLDFNATMPWKGTLGKTSETWATASQNTRPKAMLLCCRRTCHEPAATWFLRELSSPEIGPQTCWSATGVGTALSPTGIRLHKIVRARGGRTKYCSKALCCGNKNLRLEGMSLSHGGVSRVTRIELYGFPKLGKSGRPFCSQRLLRRGHEQISSL